MRKILLLSVLLVLGLIEHTVAQERMVSGKVTDSNEGNPLPGVNIVIKGASKGTTTDINGEYQFNIRIHSLSIILQGISHLFIIFHLFMLLVLLLFYHILIYSIQSLFIHSK